ncbi:MAG: ribonuclease H-like domain-containing protein [Clostridium sp.]
MIIRENNIRVLEFIDDEIINHDGVEFLPRELIFFDLEHYVYKKPKCIGVFGACVYDSCKKELNVTQYMIENKYEVEDLLILAQSYFQFQKDDGKKAIVTFSGNNDFTVIKYLFEKYRINYDFNEEFASVDIQKEYEKAKGTSIGLKNLEKVFEIYRDGEVISGSNLAKTFHKVLKDKDYIKRMPTEKVEKILLYNEQDVVSLYHMYTNWNKYIKDDEMEDLEVELTDLEIEETDDSSEEENQIVESL